MPATTPNPSTRKPTRGDRPGSPGPRRRRADDMRLRKREFYPTATAKDSVILLGFGPGFTFQCTIDEARAFGFMIANAIEEAQRSGGDE
jgi:hypothetical protein